MKTQLSVEVCGKITAKSDIAFTATEELCNIFHDLTTGVVNIFVIKRAQIF
ncbi:MAG: hypothetical protein ACOX36_06025 [Saccharofermentanales bacterium]